MARPLLLTTAPINYQLQCTVTTAEVKVHYRFVTLRHAWARRENFSCLFLQLTI